MMRRVNIEFFRRELRALRRSKEFFIEERLRAAHRNGRDGVPGAPVTELEYKHRYGDAVLEEAGAATRSAKLGWYRGNTNLVPKIMS